jgi:phospholipid/cholesterol/gamma-HCH transport system substrate-binding protein
VKSVEAKVGLLVLICAVLTSVTVYYVTNAEFGQNQVPYKVYFRYAAGLETGTQVLFGGMAVGKVTALRPDPADPTRIEISLNVRQGTPLNARSLAKLESTSLMSSPVVSITTGSNEAPRLPAGAVIASEETISMDEMERKVVALTDSAQSTLASIQTDLNRLTGEAQSLLVNLNTLTGETNRKHIAAVLSNADTMVAQLSSKIGPTMDNVNATVSNINATVSNINTTVGNANGTITALREPIQVDLDELRGTLEETHNLIGHLDTLLLANHQNIGDSLENIRMATDNLNDLTQSVKERPWSLVRIRQPEDRKVPQGQLK